MLFGILLVVMVIVFVSAVWYVTRPAEKGSGPIPGAGGGYGGGDNDGDDADKPGSGGARQT